MGGVSPKTCRASYKYEIKFWYTVASCWIFYVNYTMKHGSTQCMLLLRSLTLLSMELKVTGHSERNKRCCLQHAVKIPNFKTPVGIIFSSLYYTDINLSFHTTRQLSIWSFHDIYYQYKHHKAYLYDLMGVPESIAFSVFFLCFSFPRSSLSGMCFTTWM